MAEVKKAVTVFKYAEKIKTSLIVALSLLESLSGIKEEAEIAGAEKLLTAYFNALMVEVNIAANVSRIEGFRDVALKLQEAVEHMKKRDYAGVQRLVSEALSVATTHGGWAAQTLKERNLI